MIVINPDRPAEDDEKIGRKWIAGAEIEIADVAVSDVIAGVRQSIGKEAEIFEMHVPER
jgi:hypothetical protein